MGKKMKINDGTKFTGSHWTCSDEEKPIICIDFDHTITTKCLACDDGLKNNEVQEGAIESIKALSKFFQIWIYSGDPKYVPNHWKSKAERIKKFLDNHGIPYDKILCTKPPAIFIIDDRAIWHRSWFETMQILKERLETNQYLERKSK